MCDAEATPLQLANQQQTLPCKRERDFAERNGVAPVCGRRTMCAACIRMQQHATELAEPS
jgi:hypothetical protein